MPADVDDLAAMVAPASFRNNIQPDICHRVWIQTVQPLRDLTDAIKRSLVADMRVSPRD
jgi:hypothetical protein